ncbi:MAG TPA: SDR family oxidoreductase, partial [Phenylobacterium sp.]|nr:SDR family oxidoreductase [Phenylobacterium sp.]
PLTLASNRLAGKVVLVTGASSGIGAAAVRRFAAEGAVVVAAARRADRIQALADELGGAVSAVACDVREEASVEAAVAAVVARHGRLDGAFNNAGVGGAHVPFTELTAAKFDAVIATNLRGVFLCMKHEIPAMLASGGGAIVNTSSIGGLVGGAQNGDYAASKWGLAGLTKCVALEYARQGIRVNAIAPGPTDSEMFGRWMNTEARREMIADAMPMNYIAHPDDMARAALFLLSEESRWTTGVILPCEGGASAD